jgi:hypothetical protein
MDQLKTPVKKNMWDFESSNQKASVVLNPQFFIKNMGAAKNKCQGKKRIPQRLILSYTLDRGACRSGRSCSWSFLLMIHHNHFTSRQLLGCTFLLLLSWFFSVFTTLLPQPLFPSFTVFFWTYFWTSSRSQDHHHNNNNHHHNHLSKTAS